MSNVSNVFVLMGVSGCGKSTAGTRLAGALENAVFLEGDDYHSAENVEKMRSGTPLCDTDRWPWLASLSEAANQHRKSNTVIISCSCLKRTYRDYLRERVPSVNFVFLDYTKEEIESRLANREHIYMPASLLQSQFDTLERPTEDEKDVFVCNGQRDVVEVVKEAGFR